MSAGVGSCVSDKCVRRVMHRTGLRYWHSRKKGLLTRKDLKIRLAFARKVKRILNPEFWKCGISFYLDGVSFMHKHNPSDQARVPRTMAWRRRPGEGLMFKRTARGNHEGTGAKVAHFVAAIGYGKGVVLCEQFHGKFNGQTFSDFIHEQQKHLPIVQILEESHFYNMGVHLKIARRSKILWTVWELKNFLFLPKAQI